MKLSRMPYFILTADWCNKTFKSPSHFATASLSNTQKKDRLNCQKINRVIKRVVK